MIECVIDTHILGDLIKQFSTSKPNQSLSASKFLTSNILGKINPCINSDGFNGVVISSAFAMIEIINQFTVISNGGFDIPKVVTMLQQPPNWFVIEPFTNETAFNLIKVPKYLSKGASIELADAIHVATAIQRGPNTYLATHDGDLSKLNFKDLQLIHLA